jgi:molybdate transport system substrate-binding protein
MLRPAPDDVVSGWCLASMWRAMLRRRRTLRRVIMAGLLATLMSLAGACAYIDAGSGAATAPVRHSGPVNVLYAGSLQDMMQQRVGPAFSRESGYTVTGFSDGSRALASEIRGRTEVGDVFISASPDVNDTLEGTANGRWVSWYAEFATSPLVVAYNPSSKFADALKSEPWYEVVGQPGFLVGRTDPATDPKGALTVTALDQAAKAHHLPSLATIAASSANVFPETSLVGELQAGQLDAGFFYGVEATAADLKTIPLTGIAFLLGASARAILERNGLVPAVRPIVARGHSVPADLKHIV